MAKNLANCFAYIISFKLKPNLKFFCYNRFTNEAIGVQRGEVTDQCLTAGGGAGFCAHSPTFLSCSLSKPFLVPHSMFSHLATLCQFSRDLMLGEPQIYKAQTSAWGVTSIYLW